MIRATSHFLRLITPKSEFSIIAAGNGGYGDTANDLFAAGLEPTSVQITRNIEDNTLSIKLPFQDDALQDLRDICNSVIMDFTFVEYGVFYDTIKRPLVFGEIKGVEYTDITLTLTVGSFLSRLSYGQVFQLAPSCRWDFGSTQCGVNLSALSATNTIGTISSDRFSFTLGTPVTFNQYYNGKITIALANQTIPIDISVNETNRIYLWEALPSFISSGQAITLFPGCRKNETDCRDVYNNLTNFGGVPKLSGNFHRGTQQYFASSKNLR